MRRNSNNPLQLRMEVDDTRGTLLLALSRVLRSLARVALRYGVSAGAMSELVRRAWVDEAERMLLEDGRAPRSSRVCALTGLYRKEVVRLKALPPIEHQTGADRYDRSARVVSGWVRDSDFHTRSGKPAVLSLDGETGFAELVRRYSGDMTSKAMQEELLRAGLIEQSSGKRLKLVARANIPEAGEIELLHILGADPADLIDTIGFNLTQPKPLRRFQRKVHYRHIPARHEEAFREFAAAESQALLESLDRWLARHDTEQIGPDSPGASLGLGIYLVRGENNVDGIDEKEHNAGTCDND